MDLSRLKVAYYSETRLFGSYSTYALLPGYKRVGILDMLYEVQGTRVHKYSKAGYEYTVLAQIRGTGLLYTSTRKEE